MNRFKLMIANQRATINETPIIVLGNQKSGTSAIAHLLADATGLTKTVDIPPLWPPTLIDIMHGNLTFAETVRKNKYYFSTQLIKEPNLTFMADQVFAYFPKAKYIFIVRDPRDNIRSILNRRKLPGNLDAISDEIIPPKWRGVIFDTDVWGGAGENYIGVLAHRWNKAVAEYLKYEQQIVLVRYEDFMADKVGSITDLAQTLSLKPLHDISDKVDIQYQRKGDHSVKWQDFFGDNLPVIERICHDYMIRMGYE